LAFIDYEAKFYDEAIVLADYAARGLRTVDADLARESAHLALAACLQEYDDAPEGRRTDLVNMAKPIAEFLIRNWPDNDRAKEAQMIMAELCNRAGRRIDAVGWLADCRFDQKDFQRAVDALRGVIAERPEEQLDLQIMAARLLQEWGDSGEPGTEFRSQDAIRGLHDSTGSRDVWGWSEVANRIERALNSGGTDNKLGQKYFEKLRQRYFEARYNIPACRRQFATRQKNNVTRINELQAALGEVEALAHASIDFGDDSWRRLNAMYQEIEVDLNRPPTQLRKANVSLQGAAAAVPPSSVSPKTTPTPNQQLLHPPGDAAKSPK
jgi:hypothetical protein